MVPNSPEPHASALAPLFVIHAEADDWFVHGQLFPALGLTADEVRLSSRLPLGELTLEALERNIATCRATLVVVSPAATAAPWAQYASALARHAAVEGEARLIPLVLEDGEAALWLRAHVSIDLRDPARRELALTELAERLGQAGGGRAGEQERIACPYPGMRSLGEGDAALLFGREQELADLTARLTSEQRALVLVGASGSGKSSLVRAGLLPKLTQGPWPALVVRELRPGQHPLQRLEEALAAEGEAAAPRSGEWRGRAAALLAGRGDGARLLVLIDQLEEAFALAEPDARKGFFAALGELRAAPRCHLILCLRADFLGELMTSSLWRGGGVAHRLIDALSGEPLRTAIVAPARAAGVYLEPALVERLLVETEAAKQALPLLQAALVQLWEQRTRRLLSLAAYQRLGGECGSGLGAAMSRHADACLSELAPARQKIARRVLLRLVSFGEGTGDTRRPRPPGELAGEGEAPAELEAVIEHLTRARLVVRDGGRGASDAREATVELAHEALIASWATLAGWIRERRADGQRLRQHEDAAAAWVVRGRGAGGLLQRAELGAIEQWRRSEGARELGESAALTAFVQASAMATARRGRLAWGAAALVATLLAFAAVTFAVMLLRGREIDGARTSIRALARDHGAALEISKVQRTKLALERAAQALREGKPQAALPLLVEARELRGEEPPSDALALMFGEATRATLQARLPHAEPIVALALSPDAKLVATASLDGSLRLWHLDGTAATGPLRHARGAVTSVAFFPDGKHLVSGGEDGTARLWDLRGRPGLVLLHGAALRVVRVSPDGRKILTGGADNRARLWDGDSGGALAILPHPAPVGSAAFSRDGALVVTASDDHAARVWQVRDGAPVGRSLSHKDNLATVEISPDNRRVLTATVEDGAKLWELRSGTRAFDIPVAKGLASASYSPDGRELVTAGDSASARRWSAQSGASLGDSMSHDAGLNAAVYSGDGRRIATVSNDRTARLWDAATSRPLTEKLPHEGAVRLVALNHDGTLMVTASDDKVVRIWRIAVPAESLLTYPHLHNVIDLAFSAEGRWLVTASADKLVQLWDASRATVLMVLPQDRSVEAVALSADRSRLAVAAAKRIRLWDPNTRDLLPLSFEHGETVKDLEFQPGGELLVAGSRDGLVRGWGPGGEPAFEWQAGIELRVLAVSPDGATIAAGGEGGELRVWDVRERALRQLPIEHNKDVLSLQFSPDGRLLLSSSEDHTARLWRLSDGKLLLSLAHKKDVKAARFSPDGRWIATASRQTVTIWEAASGSELLRRSFDEKLRALEWSPDGRWIAVGGLQRRVERWSLLFDRRSLAEWRDLARRGALELDGEGQLHLAATREVVIRPVELDDLAAAPRCWLRDAPRSGLSAPRTLWAPPPDSCPASGLPFSLE